MPVPPPFTCRVPGVSIGQCDPQQRDELTNAGQAVSREAVVAAVVTLPAAAGMAAGLQLTTAGLAWAMTMGGRYNGPRLRRLVCLPTLVVRHHGRHGAAGHPGTDDGRSRAANGRAVVTVTVSLAPQYEHHERTPSRNTGSAPCDANASTTS